MLQNLLEFYYCVRTGFKTAHQLLPRPQKPEKKVLLDAFVVPLYATKQEMLNFYLSRSVDKKKDAGWENNFFFSMRVMQGYDPPRVGICYNFRRKSSHLKKKLQIKWYENSWCTHDLQNPKQNQSSSKIVFKIWSDACSGCVCVGVIK